MVGGRLLIHKANRQAKRKREKSCSLSFSDSQKVGIIFTVDDLEKHNHIKDFIKKLKQNNKSVEVLCFLPKDRENHEFIFSFFTEKDISLWGNHTNDDVLKFIDKPFDFLFCLDCQPHPFVESVLGMTKASCRVGCYKEGKDHFFELMIHPAKPETGVLVDDIFRYIKLLK